MFFFSVAISCSFSIFAASKLYFMHLSVFGSIHLRPDNKLILEKNRWNKRQPACDHSVC